MVTTDPRQARVLVVEDNQDSASLLTEVLGVAGFQAAAVAGERLVADIVRDEAVSVVLISFSGSGIAATTRLVAELRSRPEPPLAEAGIVVLIDDAVDARFGLSAEADAVLVRPVDADRLVDAVTEVSATSASTRRSRRGLQSV